MIVDMAYSMARAPTSLVPGGFMDGYGGAKLLYPALSTTLPPVLPPLPPQSPPPSCHRRRHHGKIDWEEPDPATALPTQRCDGKVKPSPISPTVAYLCQPHRRGLPLRRGSEG